MPVGMSLEATANIVCPGCGYDLRGRASDRCPECGLDVAGIESRPSAIPWVHRRKIGRIRAYLGTLRLVHGRTRWAANEIARPVDAAAAKSFRRVNAAVVGVALLGLTFALRAMSGDDPLEVLNKRNTTFNFRSIDVAWLEVDLALPWTVGIGQWPTVGVAVLLFAVCWTGLASLWFCPRSLGGVRRSRAAWLSLYASGLLVPIVIVLSPLVLLAFAGVARAEVWLEYVTGRLESFDLRTAIGIVQVTLAMIGVVLLIWNWTRLSGLLRATCAPGLLRRVSLAIGFPIASLVLMALCATAVPWVAGYFIIAIPAATR